MRIFVAGGAGYIGSCCTEFLLDHGHQVTVFDALLNGHRQAVDPRADFIAGNLADEEALQRAIAAARPDGAIHFAAFIEVGESMRDPLKYFRNNVAHAILFCQAVSAAGVRKIVFSSTAAVYGIPDAVPITEQAPLKPINPYGDSKLMFEKILEWQHQLRGQSYTALRYFNACGATHACGEDHNPESHLIPLILQAAAGQRPAITVFGNDYDTPDGTCIRDYVHVLDLAQAHLQALESDFCGSLNLGSGQGYSVLEVIEAAKRVTGRDFPVEFAPRRHGDPPRLVADSRAARRILGWTPRHDNIDSIIRTAWEWRCRHPKGY